VSGLAGRLILVVEDEPLVALDIAQSFERAGARVITTRARSDAIAKSEGVSAAILDFGVADGDGESLYAELKSRGIPFVIYSGYSRPAALDIPFITKPTDMRVLLQAIEGLLDAHAATA
jgi:DNA-binding response OmpR family regulator